MRQSKIEVYPDGFDKQGNPKGPKIMVLDFRVTNQKRWNRMTKKDKALICYHIARFQGQLERIKNDLHSQLPKANNHD